MFAGSLLQYFAKLLRQSPGGHATDFLSKPDGVSNSVPDGTSSSKPSGFLMLRAFGPSHFAPDSARAPSPKPFGFLKLQFYEPSHFAASCLSHLTVLKLLPVGQSHFA